MSRIVSISTLIGTVALLWLPAALTAQGPAAPPQRTRDVPPAGGCPGEPRLFYRCATEKAKTFTSPRTPFGQPDLQGYYTHGRQNYDLEDHPETFDARQETTAIVDPPDGTIPYQAWAEAKRRDIRRHLADPPSLEYLNPNSRCYLRSPVPQLYAPFPLQIVQTPTHVLILQEQNHAYQIIPVDGRPHLGPAIRLWMGDSRGWWEGNTLVVESTNLAARLANRNWLDQSGNFYTDKAYLVQRFIPVDADTLIYEATIDDPAVFTRPWTLAMPLRRQKDPGFELLEFACREGNRAPELSLRPGLPK
ncbi:MAG: hypothetical protein FJ202_13140 [Gemmatimonadetes bacterium]|nr:hypothetical protein [Gemmatimonadota bacterium]